MADYSGYIQAAATQYGLDPNALTVLFQDESGLDNSAVNPDSGAYGIAQLLPKYFPQAQFSTPQANISQGAQVYAQMLKKYNGNIWQAVLGYKGYSSPATDTPLPHELAAIKAMGGGDATANANGGSNSSNTSPTANLLNGLFGASSIGSATDVQTSPTNNVASKNFDFLTLLSAGGWAAILLIIAGIGLFFGLSGLIKSNKV